MLLAKTGPTNNFASAAVELKGVRGTVVTELGYDIRKFGAPASAMGSHCGAGAPRFLVITQAGTFHVIGCNSPPGTVTTSSTGWTRLRWTAAEALPPIVGPVDRILIIFDEGQDRAPDYFGAAVLDNIDVNGVLVGKGPTDAD